MRRVMCSPFCGYKTSHVTPHCKAVIQTLHSASQCFWETYTQLLILFLGILFVLMMSQIDSVLNPVMSLSSLNVCHSVICRISLCEKIRVPFLLCCRSIHRQFAVLLCHVSWAGRRTRPCWCYRFWWLLLWWLVRRHVLQVLAVYCW